MSSENRSTIGKAGLATVNAYRFCKWNASVIDQASAATDAVLGVAAETAATGKQLAVVVSGFVEVDFAAAVAPGTQVTSDGSGKAVAAAVAAPTPNELILGEYCPLPVDGTSSNSTSGARGRILLYDNKAMIKE